MAGESKEAVAVQPEAAAPECGIVMPISEIDGCPATHWADVLGILTDALTSVGFKTQIVSNNGSSPIIQKRIVQSLYFSDLIVCDVSGKNANVMLELGMRLAFDKPVVLVKDDKTAYSFDISPLEHLSYPRDLRFGPIIEFKEKLGDKARTLHAEARKAGYGGSYLKSFGDFKVAQIDKTEVPREALVLEEIKNLRQMIEDISPRSVSVPLTVLNTLTLVDSALNTDEIMRLSRIINSLPGVESCSIDALSTGKHVFNVTVKPGSSMTPEVLENVVGLFTEFRAKATPEIKNLIIERIYRPALRNARNS